MRNRKSWYSVTLAVLIASCLAASAVAFSESPAAAAKRVTCVRPTKATLDQRKNCYFKLVEQRKVRRPHIATRSEIASVAANLCDNTVPEMETYVSLPSLIGEDPQPTINQGASVIDAFCPDSRLQFEAAADQEGLTLPRAPKYK